MMRRGVDQPGEGSSGIGLGRKPSLSLRGPPDAPYNAQVSRLQDALVRRADLQVRHVRVGTVDPFQGQEALCRYREVAR